MANPRVIILGAGPAGVGAAYRLRQTDKATVTVVEQGSRVGGNAGSFAWHDHQLDFGSHRFHPAASPQILGDVQALLGLDLLDRPRHGRIQLRGRWIHFPLKPLDLLLRLDRAFALGVLRDMVWRRRKPTADDFAAVLQASLGRTICESFYFPYARKIWGAEPATLSGIQARRRVSAGSFAKLVRKVLSAVPGLRPPTAGRFYYPTGGFGQISEAYATAAERLGADLRLGTRVTGLVAPRRPGEPWVVTGAGATGPVTFEADHCWSTLPIPLVARMLGDATPPAVVAAARGIQYRSMVLIYLELAVEQFTEFDAHYFPDAGVRITRLSEPKNYAARAVPRGRTVLCAELPTSPDEATWTMTDTELGELVARDLASVGLPLPSPPTAILVKRLRQAYPIYAQGYEHPLGVLDAWAEGLPRFLTYGRQGLFAHDNTHHALAMAYAAADCFGPDGVDPVEWQRCREDFAKHVVED